MPVSNGFVELIYSNVPEPEYAVYDPLTTYSMNSVVSVVNNTTHRSYRSLVDNNKNNPVTDTTKWLDIGATNRWKMFDSALQSQTKNVGFIKTQFHARAICTTVALLNINATSVQVRMYVSSDGLVYDKTVNTVGVTGAADWNQYFFNTIGGLIPDVILTDLPAYRESIIEVTLNAPSDLAACGAVILGNGVDIGGTQYGAKVGITDYSVKSQDPFGNYTITERVYRKTAEFMIAVDNYNIDQLQLLLAQYRATPILYLGSEAYSSTAIYGFYQGFDITINEPTVSICSINLEGLT